MAFNQSARTYYLVYFMKESIAQYLTIEWQFAEEFYWKLKGVWNFEILGWQEHYGGRAPHKYLS